jgi:phosphatidylinositol dimannoside acyltransferase
MRAGSVAARVLRGPVGRGLAEGIGVTAARLPVTPGPLAGMGRRRRMVARHLRRVYGPDLAGRDLDRRVAETFASYARYWEESLRLPSLTASGIRAGVRYDGIEHIQAGEAVGRGAILALPHLGCWEWGGAGLVANGHALSVVVETLHPPDVFDWFVSFRERLGMQVIPTGAGAAVACRRALDANHLLCLLSDRLVGGAAGVEVEFFGERTLLPAGPVTLALRTGAALLPCAVYFESGVSQRVGFIRPALQLTRSGRLRDDVQRGTQLLAVELEALIARAPTQWHLMQPNWPSDVEDPQGNAGSPHPADDRK